MATGDTQGAKNTVPNGSKGEKEYERICTVDDRVCDTVFAHVWPSDRCTEEQKARRGDQASDGRGREGGAGKRGNLFAVLQAFGQEGVQEDLWASHDHWLPCGIGAVVCLFCTDIEWKDLENVAVPRIHKKDIHLDVLFVYQRARDGDRTRDPLLGKEVLHR